MTNQVHAHWLYSKTYIIKIMQSVHSYISTNHKSHVLHIIIDLQPNILVHIYLYITQFFVDKVQHHDQFANSAEQCN